MHSHSSRNIGYVENIAMKLGNIFDIIAPILEKCNCETIFHDSIVNISNFITDII